MKHWRLHPRLPVFAVSDGATHAVYVPGRVMPASARLLEDLAQACQGNDEEANADPKAGPRHTLLRAAREVLSSWQAQSSSAFAPVCLNVQLPYACNLACAYCYSRPAAPGVPKALNRPAVAAAARLVAANCAAQGVPLQLVIQGLGEPTLAWDDLAWVVTASREAAERAGVEWQGHLSTNGQLEATQAAWLADTFSHITVSCDGPPALQEALRPRRDGEASSGRLREAVAAMAAGTAVLEARVTITGGNASRLPEVVRYLAVDMGLTGIRLEPVFGVQGATAALPPPERLALQVQEACRSGAEWGATVSLSSPDLTELHGEYCEALRHTLRLRPDGVAHNCLHGSGGHDRPRAVELGHYEAETDHYLIAGEAVARLRAAAGQLPSRCANCLAAYHCVRSCPGACPEAMGAADYRCVFQRRLVERWVLSAAGAPDAPRRPAADGVAEALAALPGRLDRESLLKATRRAAHYYDLNDHAMPAPAWSDQMAGQITTEATGQLLEISRQRRGPISVYVHLPFCDRKCLFCDCHSLVAGRDREQAYARYFEVLVRDLETWCQEGGMGTRPVTTVHFGGGTPDVIGSALLRRLMASLRGALAIGPETEWAVETTVDHATRAHLEELQALGFSRLHVGVQTLADDLRRRLGRRNDAAAVLDRLQFAMRTGLVTSVDMMYGLPEQPAQSLLADLDRLVGIGLHGVSLYRLNLSSQNRGLLRVFPGFAPQPLADCLMLQAADQSLLGAGYTKNHYVHYAVAPDEDRYFRHAVRGEDLLALGASAAGSVGLWQYRSHLYPLYVEASGAGLPLAALAGTPLSPQAAQVGAWLMSGSLPESLVGERLRSLLVERWLPAGVLAAEGDSYRLTATGSWLIGALLEEVQRHSQGGGQAHEQRQPA